MAITARLRRLWGAAVRNGFWGIWEVHPLESSVHSRYEVRSIGGTPIAVTTEASLAALIAALPEALDPSLTTDGEARTSAEYAAGASAGLADGYAEGALDALDAVTEALDKVGERVDAARARVCDGATLPDSLEVPGLARPPVNDGGPPSQNGSPVGPAGRLVFSKVHIPELSVVRVIPDDADPYYAINEGNLWWTRRTEPVSTSTIAFADLVTYTTEEAAVRAIRNDLANRLLRSSTLGDTP